MKPENPASATEEVNIGPVNAEMTKYGVTLRPVDYFHYKEFCYTNLKDALAQTKRDQQNAK